MRWLRECTLCLIIIIKSEVWTIIHCLGLGHETMVYVYVSLHSHDIIMGMSIIMTKFWSPPAQKETPGAVYNENLIEKK